MKIIKSIKLVTYQDIPNILTRTKDSMTGIIHGTCTAATKLSMSRCSKLMHMKQHCSDTALNNELPRDIEFLC